MDQRPRGTFEDKLGNQYTIDVHGGTIINVQKQTGVLLTSLFEDDMALLATIENDFVLMGNILWTVCHAQAEDLGFSESQFFENFGTGKDKETRGAQLLDNARFALMEGIADFFSDPRVTTAVDTIIQKATQVRAAVLDKLSADFDEELQTLKNVDVDALAEETAQGIRAKRKKRKRQLEKKE